MIRRSTLVPNLSRRRGLLVAAAVAAGAVLAAVLIAISATGGGGSSPERGAAVAETQAFDATAIEEVAGLPQSGRTLGDPDAPVEIVEYADLQCPACGMAAREVVPEVIDRWVRGGEAKLTIRLLAFIGPDSLRGAQAVIAAAEQDRAWHMLSLLYANQGEENSGWLSEAFVERAARAVPGLDVAAVTAALGPDPSALGQDARLATQDRVSSTPTFVVRGPGGTRVLEGVQPVEAFAAAIAEVGPQAG